MSDEAKLLSSAGDLGSLRLGAARADEIVRKVEQGARSGGEDKKIEQAAAQFEALLVQQMFGSMWKTVSVGEGGLLTGSREEELYRDMFNQALAEKLSETQSIGIKEQILKEIKSKS